MLQDIQKEIEETYRIECPAFAGDFILPQKSRRRFARTMPWLNFTEEALLIRRSDNGVDVGLWFHPRLLKKGTRSKWERQDLKEKKTFLPLVEGVSHFVYFLWRAGRDEPVTQLELEIQAEVDKFVLLAPKMGLDEIPPFLDELFTEPPWRPGLDGETRSRYETAARLALKYGHFLRREYLEPRRTEALSTELRSFYRMGQSEKIRRISQ